MMGTLRSVSGGFAWISKKRYAVQPVPTNDRQVRPHAEASGKGGSIPPAAAYIIPPTAPFVCVLLITGVLLDDSLWS